MVRNAQRAPGAGGSSVPTPGEYLYRDDLATGATTEALMRLPGQSSPAAALIHQHAAAYRDEGIAASGSSRQSR